MVLQYRFNSSPARAQFFSFFFFLQNMCVLCVFIQMLWYNNVISVVSQAGMAIRVIPSQGLVTGEVTWGLLCTSKRLESITQITYSPTAVPLALNPFRKCKYLCEDVFVMFNWTCFLNDGPLVSPLNCTHLGWIV